MMRQSTRAKAERLIKEGADPNIKDQFGRSAFTLAKQRGFLPIMTLLAGNGAMVEMEADGHKLRVSSLGAGRGGLGFGTLPGNTIVIRLS